MALLALMGSVLAQEKYRQEIVRDKNQNRKPKTATTDQKILTQNMMLQGVRISQKLMGKAGRSVQPRAGEGSVLDCDGGNSPNTFFKRMCPVELDLN